MNIDHLVTMANQIGDFFKSYPDQEKAKEEIANHLKKFWAPPMRSQIKDHLEKKQGKGLELIVADAIKKHL
ncbi:MAG: formate dehydrogenase [Candidatus Methylopumilus sp.]|nr:formate dehydrogenase [Candidatus Methylopumilus sp.]